MKKVDNSTATIDNEFTEGNPGTGTPATILPAQWLNVVQAELIKLVEMAGITPDQTGVDVNQIAKALAVHVSGLDFYNDTGAADAYVLSVIGSGEAANTEPPAYFEGQRARFKPDNANTGACTARIGAQDIKDIKVGTGAGSNPAAGDLAAGVDAELVFDAANDVWKLIRSNTAFASDTEAFAGASSTKAIVPSNFAQKSFVTNGYQKLPGGLIIQWGVAEDTAGNKTFPITFPNACYSIVACHGSNAYQDFGVDAAIISTSEYILRSGTGVNPGLFMKWIAVGN